MSADTTALVRFELFSTGFCGVCSATRRVIARAVELIPGAHVDEFDIAFHADRAAAENIEQTPTVIVRAWDGREVLRASGVPTIHQVLAAAARAVEARDDDE